MVCFAVVVSLFLNLLTRNWKRHSVDEIPQSKIEQINNNAYLEAKRLAMQIEAERAMRQRQQEYYREMFHDFVKK